MNRVTRFFAVALFFVATIATFSASFNETKVIAGGAPIPWCIPDGGQCTMPQ